jgi:hypothetical protein
VFLHEPLTGIRQLVPPDLYILAGMAYFGFSSVGRSAGAFGAGCCFCGAA